MGKVLVIFIFAVSICLDSIGSASLKVGVSSLRPSALANTKIRPEAKASSAGTEDIDPYQLADVDEKGKSTPAEELNDDYKLLMNAFSPGETTQPAEKIVPAREIDRKAALRRKERDEKKQDKKVDKPKIETSELEKKEVLAREEDDFAKYLTAQIAEGGLEGPETVPSIGITIPKDGTSSLGDAGENLKDLAGYFDIKGAKSELEKGVSSPYVIINIRGIRKALPKIDDTQVLFYKALGYLLYLEEKTRVTETTTELRVMATENKEDPSELRLIISRILELTEKLPEVRIEKIALIRKQLPDINEPAQLFKKAKNYIQSAEKLGCEKEKLYIIRDNILQYQGNAVILRECVLEALKLIKEKLRETISRSDNIPWEGPAFEVVADGKGTNTVPFADAEGAVDPEIYAGVKHAEGLLIEYKAKWNRRKREPVKGEKRISDSSYGYLVRDAKKIAELAEPGYVEFTHTPIRNLQLVDIVKLRQTHAAPSKTYVLIETTGRGGCTLLSLADMSRTIELRRDSDVSIRALRLKGSQIKDGLKNHIEVTFVPGSTSATSKVRHITYSHALKALNASA